MAAEPEHARALAADIAALGCAAQAASDVATLVRLGATHFEAVVVDPLGLVDDELAALCALPGEPPMLVAQGADEDLPRERVFSSLARPLTLQSVQQALGHALEARTLARENRALRNSLAGRYALGGLVTRDRAMREVLQTVEAVADTRATLLLLGESGTGKSLLARAVHHESSRADAPFVTVNCGALPDALLESELFGHVQGAFTGAVRDKLGRFEQAQGGTLFLDEINSASLDLQVKLLRVLQERTFERVGDERSRVADVRVIAATNRDLKAEIEAERFREDLYWRLNVVTVELPPLRERPGDLALLVEHFLARYAREYEKPVRRPGAAALAALAAYPWPGNVRQLENVLERAVLLASGRELALADLTPEVRAGARAALEPPPGGLGELAHGLRNLSHLPPLKEALAGPERALIHRALELTGGSRKRAAEMLGINRTTLFNKMRKYDLLELSFDERPA
jgi:DNA-binding NtrC family response regulator